MKNKINECRQKKGFTLAEVLITLTIIGVIAAITVPVLHQKTEKQELVTALKKAHSILSQATNMIIAEEGTPDTWGLTHDVSGTMKFYELYKKHLSYAKDCQNTKDSDCFPNVVYKHLDGRNYKNFNAWDSQYARLVLQDGSLLLFDGAISPGCAGEYCAYMWIDVNGAKSPNKLGRDTFIFRVGKNGIFPAGCNLSADQSCTDTDCTCKVLREGKMDY